MTIVVRSLLWAVSLAQTSVLCSKYSNAEWDAMEIAAVNNYCRASGTKVVDGAFEYMQTRQIASLDVQQCFMSMTTSSTWSIACDCKDGWILPDCSLDLSQATSAETGLDEDYIPNTSLLEDVFRINEWKNNYGPYNW